MPQDLKNLIENYLPHPLDPPHIQERMMAFLHEFKNPFSRECLAGHFTASAWLVNTDHTKVCLTHHKKIGKWIQLGGHADGEKDLLNVAIKEAREESGLQDILPLSENIFDMDIHLIPQFKNDPEHYHYDVRFILISQSHQLVVSDESHDLAWVDIATMNSGNYEDSLQRMAQKWITSRLHKNA